MKSKHQGRPYYSLIHPSASFKTSYYTAHHPESGSKNTVSTKEHVSLGLISSCRIQAYRLRLAAYVIHVTASFAGDVFPAGAGFAGEAAVGRGAVGAGLKDGFGEGGGDGECDGKEREEKEGDAHCDDTVIRRWK